MVRTLARLAMFVLALTMSISVFAGTKKSESLTLYNAAQINGQTLKAGDYTVKYEPNGSTAQVTFLRNGKEVAKANGQVKQVANPPEFNQVITNSANGTATISEIDFANSKTGVTFEPGTMASGNGE